MFFWVWGRGRSPPRWATIFVGANGRSLLLDWSIIIFTVIIFFTGLTGINFANSFWGNLTRSNGVFLWLHFIVWFFLIITTFKEKRDYIHLFVCAVIGATLASFTAVGQNFLPLSWQSLSGGGVIGNRAIAAGYFLAAAGLAVYLFVEEQSKRRWIYFSAAIWLIFAVLYSGTRGAFLGLIAGVAVGLVSSLFFLSKKLKIAVGAVLATICIVLASLAVVGYKTSWLEVHLPKVNSLVNISRWQTGTGSTRLLAWGSAWQGIKEKPILGWGWGNYDAIFTKYYNPQFLKFSFAETVWDKPHNWLLEIWTSSGVAGLTSYLSIFAAAAYLIFRKKEKGASKIILLSTLAGYLTQSFFLFESTNTLILFFLILAAASIDCHFDSREDKSLSRSLNSTCHSDVRGGISVQPLAQIVISNEERNLYPNSRTDRDLSLWLEMTKRRIGIIIVNGNFKRVKSVLTVLSILILVSSLFEYNYLPLKASVYLQRAHNAIDAQTWTKNTDLAVSIPAKIQPEILV